MSSMWYGVITQHTPCAGPLVGLHFSVDFFGRGGVLGRADGNGPMAHGPHPFARHVACRLNSSQPCVPSLPQVTFFPPL